MKKIVQVSVILALAAGLCLLLLTSCGNAWADDDQRDRNRSPSGAFNPSLSDSPVVICIEKDACRFETGPKK